MKIYKGWYDEEEDIFYKNKLVLDGENTLVTSGLGIPSKLDIVVTNFVFTGV